MYDLSENVSTKIVHGCIGTSYITAGCKHTAPRLRFSTPVPISISMETRFSDDWDAETPTVTETWSPCLPSLEASDQTKTNFNNAPDRVIIAKCRRADARVTTEIPLLVAKKPR